MMFQYAAVVSFLVLMIMNFIWGKARYNLLFVSAFVQSLLLTVFLLFLTLGKNYWQLLFLGIPIEAIILLSFFIKFPKFPKQKNQ